MDPDLTHRDEVGPVLDALGDGTSAHAVGEVDDVPARRQLGAIVRAAGDQPAIASANRLAIIKPRPRRWRRVNSNAIPATPTAVMKFDGSAKKPSTFESVNNMSSSLSFRAAR